MTIYAELVCSGKLRHLRPRAWAVCTAAWALHEAGSAPKSDSIAERTGLSHATVHRAKAELRRAEVPMPAQQ